MTNFISMQPTNKDYTNKYKSIHFAESNDILPDIKLNQDEIIFTDKEKSDKFEKTNKSVKKEPSINNITIIQQKSLLDKALNIGKFAITEPISLYAMLLAGSYMAKPLAPVVVFGSSLYGFNKLIKGIFPKKNEDKYENAKNIGKGTLTCTLPIIFSNKALKIAKNGGLKELGKVKEISKLNLIKSYVKCIEIMPEAFILALSKFKKALLALGIAKGLKKITPQLVKLSKYFL